MARSANVGPLGLHNLSLGESDSVVITYDETKMDKAGEKISMKNIYANHTDWHCCFFTGLAIWIGLQCHRMTSNQKLFFE